MKLVSRSFFIRLFHWEYWPFHVVYGPIYFYWIFLCIKARSFFFFNASNYTIRNGGFLMESKKEIYDLIPQQYYPKTEFFRAATPFPEILDSIKKSGIRFPMIGKPDIGMKGLLVKKLYNEEDLREYAKISKVDFLLQDYVEHKNEVGIFYCRYPDQEKGFISGIVEKEFLSVKGDGNTSMLDLIKKDNRAFLQLRILEKTYGEKLLSIPGKDEQIILVPYGSHFRGSKFLDITHLADEKLNSIIDGICKQVNGFFYGRLDIRYNSWEELKEGKNFSIIELNGAGSEPTNIYDPKHSLFFAWKEIIRHWKILYRISRLNHELHQKPYMTKSAGIEMFRQNKEHQKLLAGN